MRSAGSPSSAATKASRVETATTSYSSPLRSSAARTSSASLGRSSRWMMRTGSFMIPPPGRMPPRSGGSPDVRGRRLIDDRPEQSEVLDRSDEVPEPHRFDDVGVDAELVAPDDVAL